MRKVLYFFRFSFSRVKVQAVKTISLVSMCKYNAHSESIKDV